MLEKDPSIENPNDYISFYGLRNHRIMNGKPVTEIIYVHSKVIIIKSPKYFLKNKSSLLLMINIQSWDLLTLMIEACLEIETLK